MFKRCLFSDPNRQQPWILTWPIDEQATFSQLHPLEHLVSLQAILARHRGPQLKRGSYDLLFLLHAEPLAPDCSIYCQAYLR